MMRLLEAREFPLRELVPLASARSASTSIPFAGSEISVREVSSEAFHDVDIVLSSAGGSVSKAWLPLAAEQGAICIDNTSAFRMDRDVPLVVPEVNAAEVDRFAPRDTGKRSGGIIANPNCSTIQLVVALEPLRRQAGLDRVLVSTYQSISGAGRSAVEAFRDGSRTSLATASEARTGNPQEAGSSKAGEGPALPVFDVLPRIGSLDAEGDSEEELKMVREVPKILGHDVPVDVTCVRVPVFNGHAESVFVETTRPLAPAEAEELLASSPGVRVWRGDDLPTPAAVVGSHDVHIGRIRASRTHENGLQMWIVADNLLKGAAWNAVQIAEHLSRTTSRPAAPIA